MQPNVVRVRLIDPVVGKCQLVLALIRRGLGFCQPEMRTVSKKGSNNAKQSLKDNQCAINNGSMQPKNPVKKSQCLLMKNMPFDTLKTSVSLIFLLSTRRACFLPF